MKEQAKRVPEKPRHASRGYNTIEMLLVMLLLALLGFAIFSLIVSGTQTYSRISDTRMAQENARTAISYAEIRLRQNDIENQIAVIPDAVEGETALCISNPFSDEDFKTWIFAHDGMLYECRTIGSMAPTVELALDIVEVEDLQIAAEGNSVLIEVGYTASGNARRMRTRIMLRTPQQDLGGALT